MIHLIFEVVAFRGQVVQYSSQHFCFQKRA